MLVLTRKRKEGLVIDEEILVTILEVEGDKVKLGIEAPKDVPVHRKEIYEAIQRENKEAVKVGLQSIASLNEFVKEKGSKVE